MAAKKKLILGLKTAFIWCTFSIQRVNINCGSIQSNFPVFLEANSHTSLGFAQNRDVNARKDQKIFIRISVTPADVKKLKNKKMQHGS